VLRVRQIAGTSGVLSVETLDWLTATIPEHHGHSPHASGHQEQSEQHSDVRFMEECIKADERLLATGEVAREVPPSTMNVESVTNQWFYVYQV
jgi:hypothetical protein